jgi:hypothetical protein
MLRQAPTDATRQPTGRGKQQALLSPNSGLESDTSQLRLGAFGRGRGKLSCSQAAASADGQ